MCVYERSIVKKEQDREETANKKKGVQRASKKKKAL